MTQIFDGKLPVHYGQAYIFTPSRDKDWDGDLANCFFEQSNGLCGTATPGVIFLITGLHTGAVGMTVDVSDSPPPLANSWHEVVEAPFSVSPEYEDEVRLEEWGGKRICTIPLSAGSYRVRYCARNMGHASSVSCLVDEEPIDFYALYFWPASLAPDAVIKQTSGMAADYHQWAKSWTRRQKESQQS